MKRKAIFIGNSDGLPGLKNDFINFIVFLKSDIGGHWLDNEIEEPIMNPYKVGLIKKIESLKKENIDFAFVVFSGHGEYKRGTVLAINKTEEISEFDLYHIASRQISIFDCCRGLSPNLMENALMNKARLQYFSDSASYSLRQKYDSRIMQTPEQQVVLYACSIGEYAHDFGDGAIYIKSLLESANPNDEEFKLIGNAHGEAIPKTIKKASDRGVKQTPDHTIPKLPTSQQLIFSINPNFGKRFIYG
jgi:hypothetical protein